MKYFLLSIAVILILYSSYLLIKCIQIPTDLSEYGKGFVTGNIILFILGVALLLFSFNKFKSKK